MLTGHDRQLLVYKRYKTVRDMQVYKMLLLSCTEKFNLTGIETYVCMYVTYNLFQA